MKVCLAIAVVALGVLLAGRARAADLPRRVRLELVHAPGSDRCADADAETFRDVVDVTAGVDMFDARASARLVVTVSASTTLARGRWQLIDASGATLRERSVTVPGSCSQLVHELAITWVVAYDTPGVEPPPAPCPPPTCDDACRAQVREEMRRELIAAGYRRRMDGVSVAVLAGGLLSAGFTANVGPGLFLGGELHGDWLSASLEARVLFPSYVETQPGKTRFDVTTLSAALAPCARWEVLMGCAVVDIGMLIADVTQPPAGSAPVVATLGLGPRFALRIPLGDRFAIRAFADLRFAPVTSRYSAIDTGNKWESGIVSGLFGAGLSFE